MLQMSADRNQTKNEIYLTRECVYERRKFSELFHDIRVLGSTNLKKHSL